MVAHASPELQACLELNYLAQTGLELAPQSRQMLNFNPPTSVCQLPGPASMFSHVCLNPPLFVVF